MTTLPWIQRFRCEFDTLQNENKTFRRTVVVVSPWVVCPHGETHAHACAVFSIASLLSNPRAWTHLQPIPTSHPPHSEALPRSRSLTSVEGTGLSFFQMLCLFSFFLFYLNIIIVIITIGVAAIVLMIIILHYVDLRKR